MYVVVGPGLAVQLVDGGHHLLDGRSDGERLLEQLGELLVECVSGGIRGGGGIGGSSSRSSSRVRV